MEKKVAEKYSKLYQACNQYPEIVLGRVEDRGGYLKREKVAPIRTQTIRHAKEGFIEKFCL